MFLFKCLIQCVINNSCTRPCASHSGSYFSWVFSHTIDYCSWSTALPFRKCSKQTGQVFCSSEKLIEKPAHPASGSVRHYGHQFPLCKILLFVVVYFHIQIYWNYNWTRKCRGGRYTFGLQYSLDAVLI